MINPTAHFPLVHVLDRFVYMKRAADLNSTDLQGTRSQYAGVHRNDTPSLAMVCANAVTVFDRLF